MSGRTNDDKGQLRKRVGDTGERNEVVIGREVARSEIPQKVSK